MTEIYVTVSYYGDSIRYTTLRYYHQFWRSSKCNLNLKTYSTRLCKPLPLAFSRPVQHSLTKHLLSHKNWHKPFLSRMTPSRDLQPWIGTFSESERSHYSSARSKSMESVNSLTPSLMNQSVIMILIQVNLHPLSTKKPRVSGSWAS